MNYKPLKITEYFKEGTGKLSKQVVLLLPIKETTMWKFVNITKCHVTPFEFDSKEEALIDFMKYTDKMYKVTFEDFEGVIY